MSKPKGFEKPTGVKDYLPDAVAKLRGIETRVLACMDRWGYRQVMTPTLEFYDTVGAASSTSDNKLFKLLDQNGRTLVLRSDITAPIARVVASMLKDHPFPLRLSYHSNVFRTFEEEAGRESEFFQTGVELVGDGSPEADAEVIALAIASLKAAGVERFKIAFGHVGFLNGILEETLPGRVDDQKALKDCLLHRDYVGYRALLKNCGLNEETRSKLEDIIRLRGGEEVCGHANQLTRHSVARESIGHLCEIWDVLRAYGVTEHVLIDLTMIGDFSYYTGMTFEGYAADLGFPVCSGGRYDNLLTQFGRPAPATGFALKTNRILEIASGSDDIEKERVLVLFDSVHRREALGRAVQLRTQGFAVEAQRSDSRSEESDGVEETYAGREKLYRFRGNVYHQVIRFHKKG